MTRWSAELDDWQAWLDRLASALDAGDWDAMAEQPQWEPPADMSQFPDAAEQRRLAALTLRAADLRARLEEAMARAAEDVSDQRRVRGAHDAYRAQGRRRGSRG